MKKKTIVGEQNPAGEELFSEEEKTALLKKLTPGAPKPTTNSGWALLASQGFLKEAWEREKIPLPD